MRSVKLVLGLLVLAFVVMVGITACSSGYSTIEIESSNFTEWEVVQSPITGKCYELLTHALGYSSGVMTATEVDCKFLTGE